MDTSIFFDSSVGNLADEDSEIVFERIILNSFESIILKLNKGGDIIFERFFDFIDRYIIEFDYWNNVGLDTNEI